MRHLTKTKLWITLTVITLSPFLTPLFAQAEGTPPPNRVSMEKAREVAKHAYSGEIKSEELEFEGGRWIYSFDMKKTLDKSIHEVNIDAISGKVLNVHAENAAEEKKELKEDAKKTST